MLYYLGQQYTKHLIKRGIILMPRTAKNEQRAVEYAKKHFGIQDMPELIMQLGMISEESKKIYMAKWGLDGGSYCPNFARLTQKTKATNSEYLYRRAEIELRNLVIFVQKDIPDELCEKLTTLIILVIDKREEGEPAKVIDAKELIWVINTKLSAQERQLIYRKFELASEKGIVARELAKELGLMSQMEIYKLQSKILRKIKKYQDSFVVKN